MQRLQIQTFLEDRWLDAATLTLDQPESGVGSPSSLDYEVDYFMNYAAADAARCEVRDLRAVSVLYNVDFSTPRSKRWLPFVLDLIPQGRMRGRLAAQHGWSTDDPRLDIELLLKGAGSPIGNMRVLEARRADEVALAKAAIQGVGYEEMLTLDERFLEIWDKAGLISGGSEGLQGDWPKILMTKSKDGLWYPDALVDDTQAVAHVLVKRSRSRDPHGELILRNEPGYLKLARAFGLRVYADITPGRDIIIIPRFDRQVDQGKITRLGQESMASAVGTSEFGAPLTHTRCVDAIRSFASDPEREIQEYLLRDVLNLASGNPDNHGRNTAFQKFPDGRMALTPLFDFAPMDFVHDGPRMTRWNDITDDSQPDWTRVADACCRSQREAQKALARLKQAEPFIRNIKAEARNAGIEHSVIERAMRRHGVIADSLAAIPEGVA